VSVIIQKVLLRIEEFYEEISSPKSFIGSIGKRFDHQFPQGNKRAECGIGEFGFEPDGA
jgi:hypothetical protein